MMKKLFLGCITLACLSAGFVANAQQASDSTTTAQTAEQAAQTPNPIPELQKISEQMLAALKENKASMQKNPQVVYKIVNSILLPHVDTDSMARSALGRSAWMSATPHQKKAFTEEFIKLMTRTYAAGLSSYTDERVEFLPIRGGVSAGQTRTEVQSKIIRDDGPPIAVDYRLVYIQGSNNPKKDWYVYDFSVEGVSMIVSFRSQFASQLSSGVDMDALIAELKKHNEANN
jgi:phospholipid transport system substrate-binding protein